MKVIGFNNLCDPAFFYLLISVSALIVMGFQNFGTDSVYCLGSYSCYVPSITLIFVVKIMYIIFWTWILNIICKAGYTPIAWFLFLFPFILLFILISLIYFVDVENPFRVQNWFSH